MLCACHIAKRFEFLSFASNYFLPWWCLNIFHFRARKDTEKYLRGDNLIFFLPSKNRLEGGSKHTHTCTTTNERETIKRDIYVEWKERKGICREVLSRNSKNNIKKEYQSRVTHSRSGKWGSLHDFSPVGWLTLCREDVNYSWLNCKSQQSCAGE